MTAETPVSIADVEAARDRLAEIVHRTPLDRSTTFAEMSGARSVGSKLENTQRTGSFKIRGAYNCMAQLAEAQRERGVIAASAGNHAQGVALAGDLLGIEATIVVPEITPASKIAATRGYGAEVVVEGDIYERSYEHALDLAEREDLEFVHPFDDERVIAGQGTVGLELFEQYPELDTVLVAISGGGLIGGIATALKAQDRDIRVLGVQPEGAAHAGRSLENNEIYERETVDTVADGIADTRLLETTFETMRGRVDGVVTVSDSGIAAAVALLAERAKTVVEPAGAAPLAALLSGAAEFEDEDVAVVLSGGNADLSDHADLVRQGLIELGRYATPRLAVEDRTRIGTIAKRVAEDGVKLADVRTGRRAPGDDPNRKVVEVGIEGSSPEHLRAVLDALEALEGVCVVDRGLETDPVFGR
ncbi:threonine ammonia-lyase [Halalkalicoccus jeotgali]|uniref:threonine ammonia-lyase n=1 Tax=Halalkalicoccus jeotgali (strain DSM 18796 / CECT 7217 / JCM 14584 / KCTC 4019 / B3) TaxID=795797 RepID=D8J836_HALJB|nr:threonine ammonia-lyase [Halalkalicoccus jeotgali]ADJ14149.1 threonine dehydratase [Halalkalicoccus jeotgali B3]ELY34669.1 threonine dehydratase [Halalkalicoccus jeotgali B3]